MEMLLDLGNDPSMIGVLNDKDLMRAIQQGNLSTVIKDPKIQKLMKSLTLYYYAICIRMIIYNTIISCI